MKKMMLRIEKQPHGELIAERVVAVAEEPNHGNGEAGHDEAGGVGGDLAIGRDAVALVGIRGHDRRESTRRAHC